MENEFIIDIDTMNDIALNARNALAAVNDCTDLLGSVVTHDDWTCKERDAINECIIDIRSNAISIRDAFEEFSSAVTHTADRYIEMVNSEQNEILEINQALGDLYALTCCGVVPTIMSGSTTSSIVSGINNVQTTAFDCNAIYNLNSQIQLTDFAEVSQMVTGS